MSLREAIGRIAQRFNNAQFESERERSAVAGRLRERIGNALEGGQPSEEGTGEVNYRGLYNRVQNAKLSDEDKRGLLTRIKNAAASAGEDSEDGTGPAAGTALGEADKLSDEARGEIEKRRLLAKV